MRFLILVVAVFLLVGCGVEEKEPKVIYVPTSTGGSSKTACRNVPSCRLDCEELYECKLNPSNMDPYYQCQSSKKLCLDTQVPN